MLDEGELITETLVGGPRQVVGALRPGSLIGIQSHVAAKSIELPQSLRFASRGVRVHPRKDLSPDGTKMSLEVGKIRSSQICFCHGDVRTVRAVLAVQKPPKSTDGIVPSGSYGSKALWRTQK